MSKKSHKLLIKIINKSRYFDFLLIAAHGLAITAVLAAELNVPVGMVVMAVISASACRRFGMLVGSPGVPDYLSFASCERCRIRYAESDWQNSVIVSANRVFGSVLLNIKPETGGRSFSLLLCAATLGSQQLRQLKIWLTAC